MNSIGTTGCGACNNVLCSQHGCQYEWGRSIPHPYQPWNILKSPQGCVCPPTSEQTCRNPNCPRKPPAPLTVTCSTGAAP